MEQKKEAVKLYLIIGLPGSGKSTFAKAIWQCDNREDYQTTHHETDEYFVDPNTHEYVFDPDKLGEYHQMCREATKRDLQDGINVVVSNTMLTKWERKFYFDIARETGANVVICIMRENHGSVHNIPPETIEKMKAKWEEVSSDEFIGLNVDFR